VDPCASSTPLLLGVGKRESCFNMFELLEVSGLASLDGVVERECVLNISLELLLLLITPLTPLVGVGGAEVCDVKLSTFCCAVLV